MLSMKKMQENIAIILLIGTLLSTGLVLIGGTLYLLQYGSETMQSEVSLANITPISIKHIWQFALSFTPLGLIELGLLLLVTTQIVRVALLCWFYTMTGDYKFFLISSFILIMLVYSLFWRS